MSIATLLYGLSGMKLVFDIGLFDSHFVISLVDTSIPIAAILFLYWLTYFLFDSSVMGLNENMIRIHAIVTLLIPLTVTSLSFMENRSLMLGAWDAFTPISWLLFSIMMICCLMQFLFVFNLIGKVWIAGVRH